MFTRQQYLAYFSYVLKHKRFVFKECRKLGVPFWMSIIHDWDKFLPSMFNAYIPHFRNPDGTRIQAPATDDLAFDTACVQHYNRNKHHWQYWLSVKSNGEMVALPMPDVYRREMLADWRGAGKALGFPDTRAWYIRQRDFIILHPETWRWIEDQLEVTGEYPNNIGL